MTKSLADSIARVQTLMDGITSIRTNPEYPPDMIGAYPACVVYMGSGEWHCQAGQKEWRGNIVIEILVPRMRPNLSDAFELLTGYAESVANALEDEPTLNETCDAIMFPIIQEAPAATTWGTDELVSVRWQVPITVANAIT